MGIDEVKFKHQKDIDGFGKYYYPSVECGHINIEKAKTVLGWKPTQMDEALVDTVAFFLEADKYKKEFGVVVKKFQKVYKYYPDSTTKKEGESIQGNQDSK